MTTVVNADTDGGFHSVRYYGERNTNRNMLGIFDESLVKQIGLNMLAWNLYGGQSVSFEISDFDTGAWGPSYPNFIDGVYDYVNEIHLTNLNTDYESTRIPPLLCLTDCCRHFPSMKLELTYGTVDVTTLSTKLSQIEQTINNS